MSAEQVVVVTGGGRGIGRAVCVRFAKEGAQIVAVSRTAAELAETKSLVERAGGRCHVQSVDITKTEQTQSMMQDVAKRFGRIDVLVNAAGIAPLRSIEELTPEIFDHILAVNVRAIYLTCRAAWFALKASGGVIVNVSSIASLDPFAGFAAYGASKSWVNAWTRGLSDEGRPHRIRVFSLAPGAVETQMLRGAFPTYPKQDTLDPADVADMVHAVTQPACRYATGQTIFVQRRGD